jgi:hypothetical protein
VSGNGDWAWRNWNEIAVVLGVLIVALGGMRLLGTDGPA